MKGFTREGFGANEGARAFTLIELLVVISIIALLSSVILASLKGARSKARDARRLADMRNIQTALELYATSNNGNYPSTGGMSVVYMDPGCGQTNPGSGDWIPGLAPTYMGALPQDPTGASTVSGGVSCYMYSSDGSYYLLTAYGTVEAPSNGGMMDSNFGYRELPTWMFPRTLASCYYSTSYPSLDVIHRRSFTLTNLTTSNFAICPKIGP